MDTSLLDPSRPHTREEYRCWLFLLGAWGGCAVAGLLAAFNLPPTVALPVLAAVAGVAVGAERLYRTMLARLRRQRQRMTEAAEREKQFRAIRQAQRAAAEKYFDERCLVLGRPSAAFPDESADHRGCY